MRPDLRRRALVALAAAAGLPHPARAAPLRAFEPGSLRTIDAGPRPYVLTLWGLDCAPCAQVLQQLSQWQRRVRIVTLAVDGIEASEALLEELQRARLQSEAWVFGNAPAEALRHAIDSRWAGEKPRTYLVARNGKRTAVSGVFVPRLVESWLKSAGAG
jgi:hypothetical protein